MNTVSLNIRLVPRGFAAVSDPRGIPARAVPFVWSEGERTWRSVEPLFVTAAKREGEGAYRAVSELADGPFYHTALRIGGTAEDTTATLQRRLDTELLQLIAPKRWSCADCQRSFKKEKAAGPCARHAKEMPPAVLYKTTHPRVNRLGQYYVFGWANDFESTTPIAEHNDETWTPSLEAAAAEYEALREASRLAAEQRAQEQAASAALSPEEKQAAFERALFGADTPDGGDTDSWAPAPEFTAEQRAAIKEFIGGNAVEWIAADAANGETDLSGVQCLYGAFGYEDQLIDDLGLDELPEGWPAARPTVDQALNEARTLISAGSLLTCDESDEIGLLYAAFGREREATDMLKDHLQADARPGRCFGLGDDMSIADIATATAEERRSSGSVDHQRRIIELFRAGAISDGETYSPPDYESEAQEQAAYDALSPEEKFRALLSVPILAERLRRSYERLAQEQAGPDSWAPAPAFTAEQRAAIRAFTSNNGGSAVDWLLKNSSQGPDRGREDIETLGYIYGAFGCEDLFTSTFGPFNEEWQPLPKTRPTVDQGINKTVSTFNNLWDLLTCSEYEEVEGLLRAFGREQEANRSLRAHALGSSDGAPEDQLLEHCFDDLKNVGENLADIVARGVVGQNDHQRRILALHRA